MPLAPPRIVAPMAALLVAASLACAPAVAAPGNLFEWLGMGDLVVSAENLGQNGKYHEFLVKRSLRGELEEGRVVRVNLRKANRDRNRAVFPKARQLDLRRDYLLLLEKEIPRKPDSPEGFALVRGIRGVRDLPSEGAEAHLVAAARFIDIHDQKDDRVTWRQLEAMLEETDPLLIEIALDQHLKFRRGQSDLQGTLEPLLEHPAPEIRQRAARLLGQILEQHGPAGPAEAARARQELTARARRDPAIEVRVAATRALDAFVGPGVDEILRTIASDDPDQAVRYSAERLLYERRQRSAPAGDTASAGESGSSN